MSFHDDLMLQDQASGERSQDQWSSGLFSWQMLFFQAGDTWYEMMIAEPQEESYLTLNAKHNLTVLANDDLEWSYRGQR